MRRYSAYVFIAMIFLATACRERNNMFDVGSDDFIPPPPLFSHESLATGIYHEVDSILIGFRFNVIFADEFERTLIIHNELYYTDTVLFAQFDESVGQGNDRYTHSVYGNIAEGPYYFRIYFGGIPIGYWAILVQGSDLSVIHITH